MRRHRVVYTEAAEADLETIADYISNEAGAVIAQRFVERLIARIDSLGMFPKHRLRPNLGEGIRACGFKRYLIFYTAEKRTVTIVRILHSSRNITEALF
jgi:addiction module RelE/StbE family toxin